MTLLHFFINSLGRHLKKLELELTTDPYVGTDKEKLSLLAPLLLRAEIFWGCRKLELPLFNESIEILEQIERHAVVSISTPTGSGKSTLVPALLAADGYNMVFVTQPRRLACSSIAARVNTTMGRIAAWAVAGTRSNIDCNTRLMYVTDGLLRQLLQFFEVELLDEAFLSSRGIIFFIDEVHERSISIDLCLAFLANLLQNELHSKVKIVLSSATLDSFVERLFEHNDYHKLDIPTPFSLYPVTIHRSWNQNMFDLIEQLHNECKRDEQILCFVKSNSEVTECIALLSQLKNLQAYPLTESQSPIEQQKIILERRIFFSTTVAQTSLTFPSLKYVIDTGLINIPVYDITTDTTVLTEHLASKMTIIQRMGRLGRTVPGKYHQLYKPNVDRPAYQTPEICQSELSNIEFSLRKSPFHADLHTFKQYLPNAPHDEYINMAIRRLQLLDLLDTSNAFTGRGLAIAQLPDFGSLAMSTSVYSGLTEFGCGSDMIRLAAILGVLNNNGILHAIPDSLKRPDEGDFMTLVTLMNVISTHKNAVDNAEFKSIAHILRRALVRLKKFENFFQTSSPHLLAASQVMSEDWSNVARALLTGYWENMYVAMKELNGTNKQYYRYNVADETVAQRKQRAVIAYGTTVNLKVHPTIVLARDTVCGTDRRFCILSFIGIVQPAWLNNTLLRELNITGHEREYLQANVRSSPDFESVAQSVASTISATKIELIGNAGEVLHTELFIRNKLIRLYKWSLVEDNELNNNETLKMNIKHIRKNLHIFHPLAWKYLNETQTPISFTKDDQNSVSVSVKGRDLDYQAVKNDLDVFVWWLRKCVAIRNRYTGVPPKFLRKRNAAIEERISCIADSTRTRDTLISATRHGTRESRMEVVAWIAVCVFHCRLEGGFVRDWVVGHRREHPASDSKAWVLFDKRTGLPQMTQGLIPPDLDCHLPYDKYFDKERFLDEIHKYGFEVKEFREPWRYIFLFDQNAPTGPFNLELIEPHVALTHDRMDFNVNNLYIDRDYTKQLGQKIDLQNPPYSIDLDSTVDDILAYRLTMLRHEEEYMQQRISKMKSRGYELNEKRLSFIPDPLGHRNMVLAPLEYTAEDYKMIEKKFKQTLPNAIIELIEQVRNPKIEALYETQKKIIIAEHSQGGANEMLLFHGTKTDIADNILENGFDDRYFNNDGLFGRFYVYFFYVSMRYL